MEKVWNDQNWEFQTILDQFGVKKLGKVWNSQNWMHQIILDHFGGKRLENVWNDHSKSFCSNLVGKDGESMEQPKVGIPNHFGPLWWGKMRKTAEQPMSHNVTLT